MNRTFKPEWQKIQTLITWKLLIRSWRNFNREYRSRVCLRGWSHGSPNKSKMAAAAIFNFGKMSITPHWIKLSAPNFTGRCITAMRRWPRQWRSQRGVWGFKPPPFASKPFFHSRKGTVIKYYNLSLTTRRTVLTRTICAKQTIWGGAISSMVECVLTWIREQYLVVCNIAKWIILCIVVHF